MGILVSKRILCIQLEIANACFSFLNNAPAQGMKGCTGAPVGQGFSDGVDQSDVKINSTGASSLHLKTDEEVKDPAPLSCRAPSSRGRKSAPRRASEAVDEKPILKAKVVVPRKPREPEPVTILHSKRKTKVSSKFDESFELNMPTRCGREEEGVTAAVGKRRGVISEYSRTVKRCRNAGTSTKGGLWKKIAEYVHRVAESGTVSTSEGKQLKKMAQQQDEALRLLYVSAQHSLVRFVHDAKEMLRELK